MDSSHPSSFTCLCLWDPHYYGALEFTQTYCCVFHCIPDPQAIYLSFWWWTFGLFLNLGYYESVSLNLFVHTIFFFKIWKVFCYTPLKNICYGYILVWWQLDRYFPFIAKLVPYVNPVDLETGLVILFSN